MMTAPGDSQRSGFSLVEVIVALVILTVVVLGMTASTASAFMQTRVGQVRAQREAAVGAAVELIYASPYAEIQTRTQPVQIGTYAVRWVVSLPTVNLKQVGVITSGRGTDPRGRIVALTDTVWTYVPRP